MTVQSIRLFGDPVLRTPADVVAKILQFANAGIAVATMRGSSYLAMGGTSMGIAGSIVDQGVFESYLGMRVETVDMTEFVRDSVPQDEMLKKLTSEKPVADGKNQAFRCGRMSFLFNQALHTALGDR